MFFVGFFLQLYFFLRFKRVETFIGGGGGATFYYYYFIFFGGGGGGGWGLGGWGVQILISIETYITCDFSGGGGRPPITLWIRAWVRNK